MSAFRLFSQLNTFVGQSLQYLPGGYLKFYEAGTTTPKDVFGDESLDPGVNNGPQIALDASSRPEFDCWGEGAYFVEVYDADDVKQGEADDCEIPGAGGLTIPALESGKYLTNDGSILLWNTIREVPDPTGQSGKVLGNDGSNLLWQALQNPPVVTPGAAGSVVLGAVKFQWGADTFPNTGNTTADKLVTFGSAFSGTPYHVQVNVQSSHSGVTGGGLPASGASSYSTTTFFANIDTNAYSSIALAIPFTWFAVGPA